MYELKDGDICEG